jgi:hypothetical protein
MLTIQGFAPGAADGIMPRGTPQHDGTAIPVSAFIPGGKHSVTPGHPDTDRGPMLFTAHVMKLRTIDDVSLRR